MPAPAPPPRLAVRSADVQARAPDETVVDPEVPLPAPAVDAALEAVGLAPVLDAAVLDAPEPALAGALDELPPVPPADAPGALDVDDAAQPAARSPALSSGTTSSAFFTRSPYCNPVGDALMFLMTPLPQARLGRISRSPVLRAGRAISPAAGDAPSVLLRDRGAIAP
jgi:hypothetical protein